MRRIIGCGLLALAVTALACDDLEEEDILLSQADVRQDDVKPDAVLPYGVPIPENEILKLQPEPYDPVKHGPAMANTMSNLNLADSPDIPRDLAQRRAAVSEDGVTFPPPGDGDRGFFINDGAGTGIYVGEDVQDNVAIPYNSGTDQVIYAPTNQSAGGACIETVTVHWLPQGNTTTLHAHGFWDWCRSSPGWGTYEAMDSTWKSKYARLYSYGGESAEYMYFTTVMKTSGDCWIGYLYNFDTGTWEEKQTSCGTTQTGWGNTGWTMWESWYLQGCPTIPRIKAGWIQTLKSSGWTYLGTGDTSQLGPYSGTCYDTGAYSFYVIYSNYGWEGRTP